MSGPKVVRVVTREELLAQALDQIASLESAIARFAKLGRRHDKDLAADLATYSKVVTELRALTETNAWNVISRRCAEAIRAVDHGRTIFEENLVAEATKDRTIRRRLRDAALAIQRECRALGLEVPGELENVIAKADKATPEDLKIMDSAVVRASRMLVRHTSNAKTADAGLIRRLTAGLDQASYADWLATNALNEESQKFVRLDKLRAELKVSQLGESEAVSAAIQRIQAADESERDLLIDSLTLELSGLLRQGRQRNDDLARLEVYAPQLTAIGSRDAQELARTIQLATASGALENSQDLNARAEELLKTSRLKANATLQRKALLSGLTTLGYEVREGMATALVENGRLIVKKPAEVDYGVEIVGGAADGRLQVRMVSFQSASNPPRDKDVEVIWCGEFSQLQDSLARAGHVLQIEKALTPGAVPMKVEKIPEAYSQEGTVEGRHLQSRTL